MKRFNDFMGCAIGTSTSAVGTTLQTDLFLQRISIIITIVGGIITILIGVIALAKALKEWWKKASADGKIDKEEVDEAIEIVKDGVDDIIDKTQKGEKK